MRVKNMGRQQQKAVFANMGNKGVSAGSNTQQSNEELLKKDLDKNKPGFLHKLLFKPKLDKSLDIRKRRLTFEEFKRSEFGKMKVVSATPFSGKEGTFSSVEHRTESMKDKYVFFTFQFHKNEPGIGEFLDEQLGYNKDGETPIYGKG